MPARQPSPVLAAAEKLVSAGLSVIRVVPITKAPADDGWRQFAERFPTADELKAWFPPGGVHGVGIPCGPRSGNLAVLDFEEWPAFEEWFKAVDTVGLSEEVRACPLVRTGGGGAHVYCRLVESVPGFKIARRADKTTLIEVRGEGHQVVAPGSPDAVHKSGKPYEFLRESWTEPGSVWSPMTNDVFFALCKLAELQNKWTPPEPKASLPRKGAGDPVDGDAPGTDFNRRGTWEEAGLTEAGWKWFSVRDNETGYMVRPGKDIGDGKSASVGIVASGHGWPLFWPFTTSAGEFEADHGYSRFAVLAILKFRGDYSATASFLRSKGYGSQRARPPGSPAPAPSANGSHQGANGKPSAVAAPAGAAALPAPPRRLVGPFRPFPLETLPDSLRRYAETLAASIDCDPVYPILPALALTSASVGAALTANPRFRWTEPPALWCCVVADSGTAKSPSSAHVEEVAEDIEDVLAAAHGKALGEWQEGIDEERYKKSEVPPPVREYFRVENITIERLIESIAASPRGLFLCKDELAGWFGRFSQYKGRSGGSDVSEWCSLYEAKPFNYQRRTGVPRDIRVRRGVVAVSGGIQPGILARVLGDETFTQSGLAARLLFAMPPKKVPRWVDAEADRDILSDFTGMILRLRGLILTDVPARVGLSLESLAVFRDFMNEFAEAAELLDGGPMSATIPKAIRVALRLALIHHAARVSAADEDPAAHQIGLPSMVAGIAQARWFTAEADRVYGMLDEQDYDRSARLLADTVRRRGGRITPRQLSRINARRYPTADAAEAALESLVSGQFGYWGQLEAGDQGGRPSRFFELGTGEGPGSV